MKPAAVSPHTKLICLQLNVRTWAGSFTLRRSRTATTAIARPIRAISVATGAANSPQAEASLNS